MPNRSEIKVHSGNEISDTQGCILVGLSINTVLLFLGVSQITLQRFNDLCHDEKITEIEVRDV